MIRHIALIATLSSWASLAQAEMTLSLGKAISQIDNVHIEETPEERCPPDYICLRGWSRWTLEVEETLAGPVVKGRIHVVMMQHSPMDESVFKRKLLFVLERIDDAAERKRLHADYKLLELSEPAMMYCTRTDPGQWKVPSDRIYRQDSDDDVSFCFPDPRSVDK